MLTHIFAYVMVAYAVAVIVGGISYQLIVNYKLRKNVNATSDRHH